MVALVTVGAMAAGAVPACRTAPEPAPRPVTESWSQVTQQALDATGPAIGTAAPVAVLAGSAPAPWLLGGETVTAGGTPHVAVWSAQAPAGPWRMSRFVYVPGRDGPFETMLSFARGAQATVAFGSHASPSEGYPRPSTWVGTGSAPITWQEAVADRELFGGPHIVSLGQLAAGPHGFTIAGSWVDSADRVVAVVWRSADGVQWVRDDTDPALRGAPGETPLGYDVADSRAGLLLVGGVSDPLPGRPAHERGAMWYSATGAAWTRVGAGDPSLSAADQTVVEAVRAVPGGWLAVGERTTGDRAVPTVWTVDDRQHISSAALPSVSTPQATQATQAPPAPPATQATQATGLAVTGALAVAAGVLNGRATLWCAPVQAGRVGGWYALEAPPVPPLVGLRSVAVAVGNGSVVVVLRGTTTTAAWYARATCGP